LQPGDTQLITLTFYGHAHFDSKAKAICEVLGGPTYEILFKGEASLIDYKFDYLEIDYNKVVSLQWLTYAVVFFYQVLFDAILALVAWLSCLFGINSNQQCSL